MKRIIRKIRNDQLLKFGGFLFITSMIVNVLNYAFQIYMGRALGPADYGLFAALVSVFYIVLIPSNAIQTILMRAASEMKAKGDMKSIYCLTKKASINTIIYGLAVFILILLFNNQISGFLNIASGIPVVFVGLVFMASTAMSVNMGIFQGTQRFKTMGAFNVLSALLKLISGVLLVMMGFGVAGALGGYLLGPALVFLITIFFIKSAFKGTQSRIKTHLKGYSFRVLLSAICITVMVNMDVVLVKHYFPDPLAGYYATASILGKVIYFAASSISGVMMPKVAGSSSVNKATIGVLRDCLFYAGAISAFGVLAYFTAPYFIVTNLFGIAFQNAVPLMGLFSVVAAFYSLSDVMIKYNMSVKNFRFIWLLIPAAIAEIALITLFHSSLTEVIKILAVLMAALFFGMAMLYKNDILGRGK